LSAGLRTRPLFEDLSFGLAEGCQRSASWAQWLGKSTLLRSWRGWNRLIGHALRAATSVSATCLRTPSSRPASPSSSDHPRLPEVDEASGPAASRSALAGPASPTRERPVDALSGRLERRAGHCSRAGRRADVLLMDEPTNHLDVEGILWLERSSPERRARRARRQSRPILPGARGTRMLELIRAYSPDCSRPTAATATSSLAADDYLRGQAPTRNRSPTRSAARSPGSAGAPRRAPPRKGPYQGGGRLIAELDDARARSRHRARRHRLSPASQRRTRRLLVARGLSKSFGGHSLIRVRSRGGQLSSATTRVPARAAGRAASLTARSRRYRLRAPAPSETARISGGDPGFSSIVRVVGVDEHETPSNSAEVVLQDLPASRCRSVRGLRRGMQQVGGSHIRARGMRIAPARRPTAAPPAASSCSGRREKRLATRGDVGGGTPVALWEAYGCRPSGREGAPQRLLGSRCRRPMLLEAHEAEALGSVLASRPPAPRRPGCPVELRFTERGSSPRRSRPMRADARPGVTV